MGSAEKTLEESDGYEVPLWVLVFGRREHGVDLGGTCWRRSASVGACSSVLVLDAFLGVGSTLQHLIIKESVSHLLVERGLVRYDLYLCGSVGEGRAQNLGGGVVAEDPRECCCVAETRRLDRGIIVGLREEKGKKGRGEEVG